VRHSVVDFRTMKAKSALIMALAGVLAAASVASAQQTEAAQDTNGAKGQSTASPAPAGKALIYVYRQGRVVGAAGYDHIFVNNEYLAALHNSNYAQREVPPGTVVFTTLSRLNKVFIAQAELMELQKKAEERFRMEVEAGRTYYVKWSIGGKMKLVDAATGAKEIRGLHLAKEQEDQKNPRDQASQDR
jgi:hypothetical protein